MSKLADNRRAMAPQRMKLSVFAQTHGIVYATAHRHWQQGLLEGIQLPTGTILVSDYKKNAQELSKKERELAVLYSRVSNSAHQTALKAQSARLVNFANERDYQVIETVEEYGTGFSDRRTKLLSLLHRQDWDVLIVENPGRLMKFGIPYLQVLLSHTGKSIIYVDDDPEFAPEESESYADSEQDLQMLAVRSQEVTKHLIGPGYGPQKKIIAQATQNLFS